MAQLGLQPVCAFEPGKWELIKMTSRFTWRQNVGLFGAQLRLPRPQIIKEPRQDSLVLPATPGVGCGHLLLVFCLPFLSDMFLLGMLRNLDFSLCLFT